MLSGIEADRIAIVNGRYEPEWTDFNGSDPGFAVVELFKYLAENRRHPAGTVPASTTRPYGSIPPS